MENLTFGQRIVAYRSRLQMLQKDLAEKSGLSPTQLNYYEKDKREPNVATIKALAHSLGVTGNELLGIESTRDIVELHTKEEKQLLNSYRTLNGEGQEKVLDYIDDLITSSKYIKSSSAGMGKARQA